METRKPFWKYLLKNIGFFAAIGCVTVTFIILSMLVELVLGLPKNSHIVLLLVGVVLWYSIKDWRKQE